MWSKHFCHVYIKMIRIYKMYTFDIDIMLNSTKSKIMNHDEV